MAKEFLKESLEKLGFPHLIETFIEEEFDKSSFESLTYETLKDVIPKAGPRQQFWLKYLETYRMETSYPGTPSSTSTSMQSQLLDINSSDCDLNVADETLKPMVLTVPEPKTVSLIQDQNFQIGDITLCSNIDQLFFTPQDSAFELALKTVNGQIVETFYKRNNILKDYHRNLLTNAIIQKEFEQKKGDFSISTKRFLELTQKITKHFSTENEGTYYIAYNKYTNSVASGKLWTCYNRLKKRLRQSCSNKKELSIKTTLTEDINEKIAFLRVSLEPFEKIEKYWSDTFEYRLSEIKSETFNIQSYMKEYGILKGPQGHALLAIDFDHLFPSNSNNLFVNWPTFNNKIIKLASTKKSLAQNKEVERIIEAQNDGTGFFLLPHLFAKSTYKKGTTKRIKLSGDEIARNFILQIPDANLVTEELNLIRSNLAKQKKTLQPIVVVAGDILDITAVYIAIDDAIYGINSLINAMDYCFKSFFALNAKYPQDSAGIWTFIQREVFQIETKEDKLTTTVSNLIADLQ